MNGLGVSLTTHEVKDIIVKLRELGVEDNSITNKLEDLGLDLDRICNRLPPGMYRHYKGGEYYLHFIGRDSEDLTIKAAYQSMDTGEFWFRPVHMWFEEVEKDGTSVSRFKRLVGGE